MAAQDLRRFRGRWLLAGAAAVSASAAIGGFLWFRQPPSRPSLPAQAAPEIFTGDEVSLSGNIRSRNVISVAAPVSGKVESFEIEVGDDVYEGQLLVVVRSAALDTAHQEAKEGEERARARVNNLEALFAQTRLEASRARAEASTARSEADRLLKQYERHRMLLREGATPRLTFEKAEAEYRKAATEAESLESVAQHAEDRVTTVQKDLDAARRTLEEKSQDLEAAKAGAAAGEVRAPASGVVIARHGQAGDDIDLEVKDLVQIAADLTELQVVLEPQPPVMKRIRAGQQALVQVPEVPNESLAGEVTAIEEGRVIVSFRSPTPLIKPGLTAQVRIKLT